MIKKISLMLDYGCYPVWLYDENGAIVDNLLPEELRLDKELDFKFDDLEERYEALFINNEHEFSYIGFKNNKEKSEFLNNWKIAVDELINKVNGKYIILDEINKFF